MAIRGHFHRHYLVICCSLSDLVTLVIDVDEIDHLRCSMEKLIDERMEETEGYVRPRWHLDQANDCKCGSEKLIEISMIDDARLGYREGSIVFVFGNELLVSVDGLEYPSLVHFHCRCDTDCIVGSLVVSARRVFSGCSLDMMSRDLAKWIAAKPYVESVVFVRSCRNY